MSASPVYLIHFPQIVGDIKDIWRQFESLVDEGLVRCVVGPAHAHTKPASG